MSRSAAYYRQAMPKLRERWGDRCVMCGVPHWNVPGYGLEFAHLPGKPTGIEGKGRGRSTRYHDIQRYPESYVLLCVECHRELDKKGKTNGKAYGESSRG